MSCRGRGRRLSFRARRHFGCRRLRAWRLQSKRDARPPAVRLTLKPRRAPAASNRVRRRDRRPDRIRRILDDRGRQTPPLCRSSVSSCRGRVSTPGPPRSPVQLPELKGGDWSRGRRLFFGEQANARLATRSAAAAAKSAPDLSNLVHRDYCVRISRHPHSRRRHQSRFYRPHGGTGGRPRLRAALYAPRAIA